MGVSRLSQWQWGRPVPRSLSVRTALVFQGELHPDVQASDYIDFLVPFEDLLV